MKPSMGQRLDVWARAVTPAMVTCLLAVFGTLPVGIPGLDLVVPIYTAMAVFYWAIYRPDLLPAPVAFAIGLWQDVMTGQPPGLYALVLVLVHGTALSQRRAFVGKPFFLAWLGFASIIATVGILVWLLSSVLATTLIDPQPGLFQYGMTIVAFPLVAWLLVRVHRYALP